MSDIQQFRVKPKVAVEKPIRTRQSASLHYCNKPIFFMLGGPRSIVAVLENVFQRPLENEPRLRGDTELRLRRLIPNPKKVHDQKLFPAIEGG